MVEAVRMKNLLIPALLILGSCSAEVTRTHVPEQGTQVVQANGLTFHTFEYGDASQPLVLLLHGFPDTAHTWDAIGPELAEAGYHVVAPFMRGYTPTEIPTEDVDPQTLGQDVLELMDAYNAESAIIVGHDWGAYAAYSAAFQAPDRVRHLVTIAIPPPGTLSPSLSLAWSGRHFAYLNKNYAVRYMQRNDFQHVDALYTRWAPEWDVQDAELEPVKNAFAVEESLNAALGYYRGIGTSEPEFMLGNLTMPVLLVGGTTDLIPQTVFTEDSLPRFVGHSRVEMLDAGHFTHREAHRAFVDILLEELGRPGE